jgi:hypothetical protein
MFLLFSPLFKGGWGGSKVLDVVTLTCVYTKAYQEGIEGVGLHTRAASKILTLVKNCAPRQNERVNY